MPLSLQAGESMSRSFGVFLGPKELNLLLAVAKPSTGGEATPAVFDPQLEKTVDFGLWAVICKVLIFFMSFFHGVFGNWGVAIILLTVMVKLVLLPLTHRAMVSAESMKKLQPKIERFASRKAWLMPLIEALILIVSCWVSSRTRSAPPSSRPKAASW